MLTGALSTALLLIAPAASAADGERTMPLQSVAPTGVYSKDQVIVQWVPGSDRPDRVEARADAEVEFTSDLGSRSFQLVEVEPGQSAGEAIRDLEADPAVAVAERDGYDIPHAIPNDPLFGQLWGLSNLGLGIRGVTGSVATDDIGAAAAWDRTVGIPATVVADIDSGYRFEHPDLGPVAWTNPGEIANGLDDDGNGIADDLHGADFIGPNGDAPATDGNPTDEDLISGGHGVHTAGTIGAAGNNGVGITGVAQDVRIMPLRVCGRFPSQSQNLCGVAAQVAAINYAGQKGARVANMSLGSTTFRQTVVNAIAANPKVLFVISAGNDGENNDSGALAPKGHHYPCDYRPTVDASPAVAGAIDNIVCVAATNQADKLASFSDYGAVSVDLGAPGTETLSTYSFNRIVDDNFQIDDFGSKWLATGANGGFSRSNEAPLSSFGMTDSPGATPVANTTREATSAAVAIPAGLEPCNLFQSRTVSLGAGAIYTYEVLRNGSVVNSLSPTTSGENLMLALGSSLAAGGNIQVRFRFQSGTAPAPGNGIWLDNIELECAEPVGLARSYAFLQGTSMAAPHVTGAAGLLFSLKPSASVTEVRNALLTSVDPRASLAGKTVSGGRLNVATALNTLVPLPPPVIVPPPVPPAPTCKVPKLAGKKLARARTLLKAAACKLGKVKKPRAKKGHKLPPLVVKSSAPRTGATPATGKVDLKLGKKPPKKPKKHHR